MNKELNAYEKVVFSFIKHLLFVLAYLAILANAFYTHFEREEMFINNEVFICKKDGNYEFVISKEDGWKFEGKYFVNKENKVLAVTCERSEDEK